MASTMPSRASWNADPPKPLTAKKGSHRRASCPVRHRPALSLPSAAGCW
jgi:hypothetical protein